MKISGWNFDYGGFNFDDGGCLGDLMTNPMLLHTYYGEIQAEFHTTDSK